MGGETPRCHPGGKAFVIYRRVIPNNVRAGRRQAPTPVAFRVVFRPLSPAQSIEATIGA